MQIEALREQYETGQEGWRAAMAERARKEVTERTAAIRDKLMQERNNEIEVRKLEHSRINPLPLRATMHTCSCWPHTQHATS